MMLGHWLSYSCNMDEVSTARMWLNCWSKINEDIVKQKNYKQTHLSFIQLFYFTFSPIPNCSALVVIVVVMYGVTLHCKYIIYVFCPDCCIKMIVNLNIRTPWKCIKQNVALFILSIHYEQIQSLHVTKTYGNLFTSIIHLFTALAPSAPLSVESLAVHFSSRLMIHCAHK